MRESTCEFCETLDLSELLTGAKESSSKDSNSERLKRFYCRNPKWDYDYCPYCGMKDECPYHRD